MIQNEIFGPVITVQMAADEEEALAFANGVPYALASSVWTANHSRATAWRKNLDFGCVWINTHIPLVAEMPHDPDSSCRGTARICQGTRLRTTRGSST